MFNRLRPDDLADYREGVESGVMRSATPNVVRALLDHIETVEKERDTLLACRRGDQRCHECPDTRCCDNVNPDVKGERATVSNK